MNNSASNVFAFAKLGRAEKSIVFKEIEFKKEIAPTHSKVEKFEMNGEKFVRMTYKL